jgi:hypothetical protein
VGLSAKELLFPTNPKPLQKPKLDKKVSPKTEEKGKKIS